jgi:exosome complex component RRP4
MHATATPLLVRTPPGPPLAAAVLADTPGAPRPSSLAAPGDALDTGGAPSDGLLRGHGTRAAAGGGLAATVAGAVVRVDRLVSVAAAGGRYVPDVGDVVVGRVTEVGGKRWRVDVGAARDATLALAAVRLPGGAARRRTAEDEASMRDLYAEGDPVVGEVQAVHADGAVLLHTRARRYGRARDGLLVRLPPSSVPRQRAQFGVAPSARVALALGVNGWVWVAPLRDGGGRGGGDEAGAAAAASAAPPPPSIVSFDPDDDDAPEPPPPPPPTRAQRVDVATAAAALRALAAVGLPVSAASVEGVVAAARETGTGVTGMGGAGFLREVVERERRRRVGE